MASDPLQCPRVRFGRTGISMPILSVGGMRFHDDFEGGSKGCVGNVEGIVTTKYV